MNMLNTVPPRWNHSLPWSQLFFFVALKQQLTQEVALPLLREMCLSWTMLYSVDGNHTGFSKSAVNLLYKCEIDRLLQISQHVKAIRPQTYITYIKSYTGLWSWWHWSIDVVLVCNHLLIDLPCIYISDSTKWTACSIQWLVFCPIWSLLVSVSALENFDLLLIELNPPVMFIIKALPPPSLSH